jgi:hypothetical protein
MEGQESYKLFQAESFAEAAAVLWEKRDQARGAGGKTLRVGADSSGADGIPSHCKLLTWRK